MRPWFELLDLVKIYLKSLFDLFAVLFNAYINDA